MIKLIKERDEDNKFDIHSVQITTVSDINLPELLEAFEYFIKACGYRVEGTLEFIGDNDEVVTRE